MKPKLTTEQILAAGVLSLLFGICICIGFAISEYEQVSETAKMRVIEVILLSLIAVILILLIIFQKVRVDFLAKRKAAADLLIERRYQTLAEISPVGIFHTDANGFTTYVNPRWCEISGLSSEQALGNGWLNAVHKDDKKILALGWKAATELHEISFSEYRFIRPNGTIAWVIGQATPEKNLKNEIIGYVGTTTDITERKLAEEAVAKVSKEKDTVLNRINDSMISVDTNWHYTFLNDAALATHPLGRAETLGRSMWDIHPEMIGTIFYDKYHEAMQTQKTIDIDSYYKPMNTWFSVKMYPSVDGLTIVYTDISERKHAEIEITLANERFELVTKATNNIIWEWNLQSNTIWWNNSFYNLFGYNTSMPHDITSWTNHIHPDDKERVVKGIYKAIESNQIFWDDEYRCISHNGNLLYVYNRGFVINDATGKAYKLIGSMMDFTELKKANDEIVKEKILLDKIINSLPGVFYLYTNKGRFLRWNNNLEKVTKYSASEIENISPFDLFDIDEQTLVGEKINNVFLKGEDNLHANFLLKTKEKIPYYFTGIAIEYEGERCLMGVGIDISETVAAQEKIKKTAGQLRQLTAHLQTIREEERKRIGREIHDELGQQLTAIKMDIAWVDKKILDDNTPLKNKLKNIIQLLDGSNQSIRRILSELRPSILDDYGLLEAIDWLGRQFTTTTGIPVKFTTAETNLKTSEAIATCIFRVYQEAFTNITRYAKANNIASSLIIINDVITVMVMDDGQGFDMALQPSKQSFGILGMEERVLSLGGKFELISALGKGTKITISLPYNSQSNT